MGISDEIYLCVNVLVFSCLNLAFTILPMQVLFIKITPQSIEGTVYAIFVGTMNLSSSIISPLIGSFVNDHFLGVTRKSMLDKNDHGYLAMSAVSLALSVF